MSQESERRTYWGVGQAVKHVGTLKRYLACTMAKLTSLSDPLTDAESLLSFIEAVTNIFQTYCAKFLSGCFVFAAKYAIILRIVQVFCARSLF